MSHPENSLRTLFTALYKTADKHESMIMDLTTIIVRQSYKLREHKIITEKELNHTIRQLAAMQDKLHKGGQDAP